LSFTEWRTSVDSLDEAPEGMDCFDAAEEMRMDEDVLLQHMQRIENRLETIEKKGSMVYWNG
jgi:hypothetical protein